MMINKNKSSKRKLIICQTKINRYSSRFIITSYQMVLKLSKMHFKFSMTY